MFLHEKSFKKKAGIEGIYSKHNRGYMVKPESTYTIWGPFPLKSGKRQDYSLSLLLFNSMLSHFMKVENTKNIKQSVNFANSMYRLSS